MKNKRLLFNSTKTILNESNSNDLFMELDILLLKNSPNLNGYFFQEDFIDEIVENQKKYVGLPIVVDAEKLMSEDFLNLKHNYSKIVKKFYSEQIGSYVSFEKKYDSNNIAELHGKARVSKRNEDLVTMLMELYQSPIGLNLSVEAFVSDYTIDENNHLIVGASPNNHLMSDCIVSFPAEPESTVLKLASELNDSLKGGDKLSNKTDILSDDKTKNNNKEGVYNMENQNIDINKVIEENKSLLIESENLKQQVETLTSEKDEVSVKLNEANETIVQLGKEKDTLTAEVKELNKFKDNVVEKENKGKIETLINEVKVSLSEDELSKINQVATEKEPEKVKALINEIMAAKYKERIILNNNKNKENYFSVDDQKDLGGDQLTQFNM
ncbi:hypothetical protein [Chengkuizengella marina]|uniref:Uncharacterized protein n=1 Tax=Chengkuizengella marina TaxID=2507566 RepID=A0A6N9Q0B1_9BACL|nr:hypothetical protein [Chengkuizengella marina]NBI28606.1 hypothetical protein [Chengkuizengella marina]